MSGNINDSYNNRPFASNNPFRHGLTDTSMSQSQNDNQNRPWDTSNNSRGKGNITLSYTEEDSLYNDDNDLYVKRGAQTTNNISSYRNTNNSSPHSMKHAATNPFLDDLANDNNFVEETSYSIPAKDYKSNKNSTTITVTSNDDVAKNRTNNTPRYPTAEDEKKMLRQRDTRRSVEEEPYMRQPPGKTSALPPPSYEEAAGPKRANGSYPKEKSSHSSSTRQHHSSSISNGHAQSHHHHSHRERARSNAGDGHRPTHRSSLDADDDRYSYGSSDDERERERERRHRSRRSKEKRKSKMIIPKNVDTIDKLDVTGLFGGSFHHDGPFDAVTPHRNKNAKAPPVMAFPADGPNSTIGGASTAKSAMDELFGRESIDDEDHIYSSVNSNGVRRAGTIGSTMGVSRHLSLNNKDVIRPGNTNMVFLDTRTKAEAVHGETTAGLGSSTFLDGAPAPAPVSQNRMPSNNTVRRNKTFSQRMGSNNNSQYNYNDTNNGHGGNAGDFGHAGTYDRSRYGNTNLQSYQRKPDSFNSYSNGNNNNTNNIKGYNNENNEIHDDFDEDVYLDLPNNTVKKTSTGNKFLRRVKSLKVGRKN
ncbi:hypothetical protein TBLA_0H01700 [Henningerozyma blattae CBS 6284]|uniref:Pal1 cell morphology protein n=1 Tax=Henningerozyma blattae (strain ATCC 34711 / CBS 6284 / DSM 70876 / NBRC 10599 / NRRL Y-10934 / UCD 77-7) TaxID=1071380 RepID=I2H7V5_HENB6|nr:hypothetical protein TBLA_0H01700 [Tetrapisispora blattae CBS 6284]CCH62457.1 hypothetical protein TBLA_0H01700 [Tetrapisispora blattae CBS 6284]